ncbi:malate synthase A [Spirochaetota bacterium]|nr:malate synthase A [Spirochaetota bacterium]
MKIDINSDKRSPYKNILTDDALVFLETLAAKYNLERERLLTGRIERQEAIDKGTFPDFLSQTKEIRENLDWKVKSPPPDLEDRRVEITGPVDRKMIINGLNSGAKVYMADFEDSQSPTWSGMMAGQQNLYDAVRRTITFKNPAGKEYLLRPSDELAVLIVRPRGLHLDEANITLNGKPIAGAFVDFALYAFHNAKETLNQGTGPYFYIPKLESHEEARLWANLFTSAEEYLGLKKSTFRATVLIETITAAFEMEEILYELRDYCVGLNCGRWDYIFSYIKKFAKYPEFILPNRDQVTMGVHFLASYSKLLIQTCHKRNAHAMGGMAAQIPIKNDIEANNAAIEKVRLDKKREVINGHDGTWVAHPGLVPIALEIFEKHMPGKNQKSKSIDNEPITAADLLKVPKGTITYSGVLNNIRVAIHYMAAWISGTGCVPINNLMEDMATAEIARAQLWQWLHLGNIKTNDGQEINEQLIDKCFETVIAEVHAANTVLVAEVNSYEKAIEIVKSIVFEEKFADFLSLSAIRQCDLSRI